MLSETLKDALVEDLNNQTVTIQGKELYPISMHAHEFVNSKNLKQPPYQKNPQQKEGAPRITVDFPTTFRNNNFLSDIVDFNPETYVATFGDEEVSEITIRVTSKTAIFPDIKIHERKITEAIMLKVLYVVLKVWPKTLITYNASIDRRRAFVHNDLTPFIQADNRSERIFRLWIRHENTWNMIPENGEVPYKETYGIQVDVFHEADTDENGDPIDPNPRLITIKEGEE